MNSLKVDAVKKIAVLRSGGLGDLIVTLPALKAIRRTYPDAEIVLLGKPWHKRFLAKNRTPVDRVIAVPVIRGIREQRGVNENEAVIETFFEAMQQEGFDIAVNMHANRIPANRFIKKLQAKLSVGLCHKDAEPLDRNIDFFFYQNEVIRYLEIAKLIGAHTSDLEPEIKVLPDDEEEILFLLPKLHNKKFVVLQPCAMDQRRMWPLENFPVLADRLIQKNYEVVFTGSAEDRGAVEKILEKMHYPATNTCGEISLGGLAALLSRASLVIGPDTGPLQLARAVNTPTVSMHWAPNMITWAPVTRSIHRPLVSWNIRCPICGIIPASPYPFEPKSSCQHAVSFVKDISLESVMEAATGLLCTPARESIYAAKTDPGLEWPTEGTDTAAGEYRKVEGASQIS